MKYYCKSCGCKFEVRNGGGALYSYCPRCGEHGALEEYRKGRITALENASSVLALIPELERTREEYLKKLNEYQKLQRKLALAKYRGNIQKEEIPKFKPEISWGRKVQKGEK